MDYTKKWDVLPVDMGTDNVFDVDFRIEELNVPDVTLGVETSHRRMFTAKPNRYQIFDES